MFDHEHRENSLLQLKNYFLNQLEELNVPELVRMDTNSSNSLMNGLMLNNFNNNSQLKRIYFKNLEQSPYIFTGENIKEINLEGLLQVELNATIGNIQSIMRSAVLQNTKIQNLNLPNFKGSPFPTSLPEISSGEMSRTEAKGTSFWDNYWLADVVLGNSRMNSTENANFKFNGFWFKNSYFLHSLRLYYPYVIPMIGRGGFLTTPIGTNENDGYIYVPSNLVSSYQNAVEWSEYGAKIRSLDEYRQKTDTITDNWTTIINNCRNGNVSMYPIGGTKTVEIDGIPTQFILVGKGVDQLHSDESSSTYNSINPGKANLSWMENTITRFETPTVSQSVFTNNNPTYGLNTVLHEKLTSIYNNFETSVKNGIKKIVKYSSGWNNGTLSSADATTAPEYVWPPSAIELGMSSVAENTFRYEFFNSLNGQINYYLGATKINTVRDQKINVALRDYSNRSATSPDCLRPSSTNGEPMQIVANGSTNPYLIIGFCT